MKILGLCKGLLGGNVDLQEWKVEYGSESGRQRACP